MLPRNARMLLVASAVPKPDEVGGATGGPLLSCQFMMIRVSRCSQKTSTAPVLDESAPYFTVRREFVEDERENIDGLRTNFYVRTTKVEGPE